MPSLAPAPSPIMCVITADRPRDCENCDPGGPMALDEYAANAEIIGRDEINDREAILSVSNTDVDEALHTVADNADAIFTWDYEKGARPGLNKLTEQDFINLSIEMDNWTLSQFMHGEQGALICTAKIVETVPWIDAKYYASTQVMDEARHVEVFAKYLDEKQNG